MPPLRFYEGLVLLQAVVVTLWIRFGAGFDIHPFWGFVSLWTVFLILGPFLLAAVALRAVLIAFGPRGRRRSRAYLRCLGRPASLIDVARFVVLTMAVVFGYGWLKVFVPLLNPALHDEALYRLDNALHLGLNPNLFLINLFPYPAFFRFVGIQYELFLVFVFAGVAWYVSVPLRRERARFAAGYSALWLLGSWLYVAVPSVGPCYVLAGDYRGVHPHMPAIAAQQRALYEQYRAVRALPAKPRLFAMNPAFGVAAFPSLHVAAHAFLSVWAFRRSRVPFLAFGVVAALTFLGSLVTGWHYAVDGYAGVAMAVLCAWAGRRWGAA